MAERGLLGRVRPKMVRRHHLPHRNVLTIKIRVMCVGKKQQTHGSLSLNGCDH